MSVCVCCKPLTQTPCQNTKKDVDALEGKKANAYKHATDLHAFDHKTHDSACRFKPLRSWVCVLFWPFKSLYQTHRKKQLLTSTQHVTVPANRCQELTTSTQATNPEGRGV
jgi:hypothetical protein